LPRCRRGGRERGGREQTDLNRDAHRLDLRDRASRRGWLEEPPGGRAKELEPTVEDVRLEVERAWGAKGLPLYRVVPSMVRDQTFCMRST
jgi:hypothetical protein